MNYPAASCGGIERRLGQFSENRHARMFLSGVQIRTRLDSRSKHAGMTDLGLAIYLKQRAVGNEPSANRT
jgi:hypothetical protein